MFGDHFSPIHVLYVPLSWLWPSAESLIVTLAIVFNLSVIPVWVFLERRLPSSAAALVAIVVSLLGAPLCRRGPWAAPMTCAASWPRTSIAATPRCSTSAAGWC